MGLNPEASGSDEKEPMALREGQGFLRSDGTQQLFSPRTEETKVVNAVLCIQTFPSMLLHACQESVTD